MSAELDEKAWALIREVLRRHPEVSAAVLFGSRAKGMARPESDIDLALEGALTELVAAAIAAELEELPLPYRFDVQALGAIRSPELLAHIARVGRRVYER